MCCMEDELESWARSNLPARENRRRLCGWQHQLSFRVSSGQPCLFASQLQLWITSSHSTQLFGPLWEESHFAKVAGTRCHIPRLPHPCTLSFFNTEQENKELLILWASFESLLCCWKGASPSSHLRFHCTAPSPSRSSPQPSTLHPLLYF